MKVSAQADAQGVELSAIYEISKILSSSLDLHKTIGGVLRVLSSHLQMRRAMISLVQDTGELHVVGASGLSREEISRGRFRSGEGVTGQIMKTGTPVVVPDVSQEPLFLNRTGARDLDTGGGVIAFVGVPIKVGRDCVGVLSVDREVDSSRVNFERDVRFLAMAANLIGQTVRLHRNVAAEREELLREKSRLQKELKSKFRIDNVIGVSKRMQEVFAEVQQVAPTRSTVLLRGESGTGKELVARAIHVLSPRKERPFVARELRGAPARRCWRASCSGTRRARSPAPSRERTGPLRAGRRRHAVPGRDRRDLARASRPSCCACCRSASSSAWAANRPIRVRRAPHRGHQPRPRGAGGRGHVPRGPVLPPQRGSRILLPPLRERREDIPLLVEHFLERFNAENDRNG